MTQCILDISKDVHDIMPLTIIKELAYHIYDKYDVRSNNIDIIESANECMISFRVFQWFSVT